jgi:hypothetical protein
MCGPIRIVDSEEIGVAELLEELSVSQDTSLVFAGERGDVCLQDNSQGVGRLGLHQIDWKVGAVF